MKILTEKKFKKEVEKMLWEEDNKRWQNERIDQLEKMMHELEQRINVLEGRKECAPVRG